MERLEVFLELEKPISLLDGASFEKSGKEHYKFGEIL